MKYLKQIALFILISLPAFAGQSLRVSTQSASSGTITARASNSAVRVEFQVVVPASGASSANLLYYQPNGVYMQIYTNNLQIQIDNQIWGCCYNIGTGAFTSQWLNVRFQSVPGAGSTGTLEWEAWDINGVLKVSHTQTYTGLTGAHSNGQAIVQGDGSNNYDWGFLNVFSTNIPMGSTPPLFSNRGDLLAWTFDNTLNDSSSNMYTASMSSGSPTYVSSTGQNFVSATINCTQSARVQSYQGQNPGYCFESWDASGGHTNYLTSSGYSQSDAGGTPSVVWSKLSGPTLTITSPTSTTTTVTGVVDTTIGAIDYNIQMVATDSASNTNTATMHVGAVNMDANGKVILDSSRAKGAIFFPGGLIALGKNIYGAADFNQFHAMQVRKTAYDTPESYNTGTPGNPIWDTPQTGTVAYSFNGNGVDVGNLSLGTTLNGVCSNVATSCVVTDATKLDLTSFPTKIAIATSASSRVYEEICVASAAGNTLTFCYDGRGVNLNAASNSYNSVLGPTSWSNGAVVTQQQVRGTGTAFLSTVCPGGAGVAGPVTYSTGQVTMTPGSDSVIGISGANWTNGNGVYVDFVIQVSGTHSSTPFVWDALVSTLGSSTSITASRVWPSDADSGSFNYSIILPFYRYWALHFTRPSPYSGDAITSFGASSCESDTLGFFNVGVLGHDVGAMNGTTWSGMSYSFMDNTGYINQSPTFGINGYSEDMASWALFLRSGLTLPYTAAVDISSHWIRYPNGSGLGIYGSVLFWGGGIIGASLGNAVNNTPTIENIRPFWSRIASSGCFDYDTRESSYLGTGPALGAQLDSGSWVTTFNALLTTNNARDNSCARANGGVDTNSWATPNWNNSGTPITLTNGSATGTGTGIPTSMCDGTDVITATLTAGSQVVTVTSGSITDGVTTITIGTRFYQFAKTDATHGNLAGLWPGTSGSYVGLTRSTDLGGGAGLMLAFGTSITDEPTLQDLYACKWISSTQVTLDRPFVTETPHPSPDNYNWSTSNLIGIEVEPFFLGIKGYQELEAATQDAALVLNSGALATDVGNWEYTYGYDPNTGGMFYCRDNNYCEGVTTPAPGSFSYVIPSGQYSNTNIGSIVDAEELNAESSYGILPWFLSNPTLARRNFVDTFCAGLWSSQYDDPSISAFANTNSVANNMSASNFTDNYVSQGKWYGFAYGFGGFCANTWGAARQAGAGSSVPTRKKNNQRSFIGGRN